MRMFGFKKKEVPAIDQEQKEMIENAQKRVRQKRGLFTHFVVFVVAAIGLVIISQLLMTNSPGLLLGMPWWVWILFVWGLLLIYHAFKVFVTQRLLGPEWEKRQMNTLVAKQQERIAELKEQVAAKIPLPDINIAIKESKPKKLTMIAAIGQNNELGLDGDLPWHLPDDFKRFKALTSGHHIIMGRKTFETFPKPLPNRTHIVLTRDLHYKNKDAIIVHDLSTALAAVSGDESPFIIGGGEIYKLALPHATHIELTRVEGSFKADAYFPELSADQWKLTGTQPHPADDRHAHAFVFETYRRKDTA